jgi:transposase-like protein
MSKPRRIPDELRRKRPHHVVTDASRQAVTELLAEGVPLIEIARRLGMAPETLRRGYRAEIDAAGRRTAAHVPTPQTRAAVWMMAATGVTLENIGLAMGVHKITIARHYKQELDRGLLEANNRVAASLFKLATSPGPSQAASCMFWLKCRGRWQEVNKVEVSGAGGGQLIVYSGVLAQHDRDI